MLSDIQSGQSGKLQFGNRALLASRQLMQLDTLYRLLTSRDAAFVKMTRENDCWPNVWLKLVRLLIGVIGLVLIDVSTTLTRRQKGLEQSSILFTEISRCYIPIGYAGQLVIMLLHHSFLIDRSVADYI